LNDRLRAGEIQRDVMLPQLDADSLGLLSELMSSSDEVKALAALDLLARRGHVPLRAFDHPREAVVHRALALLDGELSAELVAVLGRLREHADPELRAAALAASTRARFDREMLERALGDDDPRVRAAALVGLAAHDGATPEVSAGIAALAAGSTGDRLALVRAIGFPAPGSAGRRARATAPVRRARLAPATRSGSSSCSATSPTTRPSRSSSRCMP
jgi:hypothetical protein